VIVIVTAPVEKACPYKDEQDTGTLTLTLDVPEGDGPELHDLAAYLKDFTDMALSHEEFTRLVALDLPVIEAKTTWTTAGLSVEVLDRRRGP
jgi:hypothetical protein